MRGLRVHNRLSMQLFALCGRGTCGAHTHAAAPRLHRLQGHRLPPPAHAKFGDLTHANTRWRNLSGGATAQRDRESAGDATREPSEGQTGLTAARPPHGSQWEAVRRWVVFSDLHVGTGTLAVCLEVLREVHRAALAHDAGVLFLGDFWDKRGSLPVEPLNRVLEEVSSWQVPSLWLVGNHDQVSHSGDEHALRALQLASRGLARVIDVPTRFMGALFLPYRRDHSAEGPLFRALRDSSRPDVASQDHNLPLRAVFCHADVVGARLNALSQARDGADPSNFPSTLSVYSGHYHAPHAVPGHDNVVYVGSPYQTSLAEAGQTKRLLVLEAGTWRREAELALAVGPRHFRVTAASVEEDGSGPAPPLNDAVTALQDAEGELQRGDRLRVQLTSRPAKDDTKVIRALRRRGVDVQVTVQPPAVQARVAAAEGAAPADLLREYAKHSSMPPQALDVAQAVLRAGGNAVDASSAASLHLDLHCVEVEGFGPFRDATRYGLSCGGVRVLSGSNLDDVGAESNGSGKTALVMSALWALTGKMQPSDSAAGSVRIADVVHDDCTRARARLEGTADGVPFVVEREGTRSRGSKLTFVLGGEDRTKAEIRMTQAEIDSVLRTDLLGNAIFLTQSGSMALLEATDRAFRDVLGQAFDLHAWEGAHAEATLRWQSTRERAGQAHAAVAAARPAAARALQGLEEQRQARAQWEAQRSQQLDAAALDVLRLATDVSRSLEDLVRAVDEARATIDRGQTRLQALQAAVEKARGGVVPFEGLTEPGSAEVESLRGLLREAESAVRAQLREEGEGLDAARDAAAADLEEAKAAAQDAIARCAAAEARLTSAQAQVDAYVDAWGGHDSADPAVCHACLQPVTEEVLERNLPSLRAAVGEAEQEAELARAARDDALASLAKVDQRARAAAAAADRARHGREAAVAERTAEARARLDAAVRGALQAERESHARTAAWTRLDAAAHAFSSTFSSRASWSALQQSLRPVLTTAEALQASCEAVVSEAEHRRDDPDTGPDAAIGALQVVSAAARQLCDTLQREGAEGPGESHAEDAPRPINDVSALTQAISAAEAAMRAARAHVPGRDVEDPFALADALAAARAVDALARERAAQSAGEMSRLSRAASDLRFLLDSRMATNPHVAAEEALRQQFDDIQADLQRAERDAAALDADTDALAQARVAFGPTGVPAFLLEGALAELQGLVSNFMLELEPSLVLNFSAHRARAAPASSPRRRRAGQDDERSARALPGTIERIEKHILKTLPTGDVKQRAVAQLSGGERRKLALALALGFVDLMARRGRVACNLLVLDEVLQNVDAEGCARAASVLRSLPHDQVVVIAQERSFATEDLDVVDRVVKQGGSSRVERG